MQRMKLQGTDGVRGPIRRELPAGESPVLWFVEHNELTPAFFEHYTYTFCSLLVERNIASASSFVVVGWDARDQAGDFNAAALQGVQKAGLRPVSVGILPTPAVALYGTQIRAAAAIVLTASHNPADQNGIKLFLSQTGLKLLPEDDVRFSQRLYETQTPTRVGEVAPVRDDSQQAQKVFCQFLKENLRSEQPLDFSAVRLLTDSAFGACQTILPQLLPETASTQHLNASCAEEINHHSGVADLEGHSWLGLDELAHEPWKHYPLLQQLAAHLRTGAKELGVGWVFDGDGDRCFIALADPHQQGLRILSGDSLMLLLASQMPRLNQPAKFCNTVESDLEATRSAQKLGFDVKQCAVGDKWILWEAFGTQLQAWCAAWEESGVNAVNQQIEHTRATWHAQQASGAVSAVEMTILWQKLLEQAQEHNLPTPAHHGQWAVGGEESGHLIVRGLWQGQPVFLGNGPHTALLVTQILQQWWLDTRDDFFQRVQEVSPAGLRLGMPIYYVQKAKLQEEAFRQELRAMLQGAVLQEFANGTITWLERREDPEMLLLQLEEQGSLQMLLFVRNSGTEDKMSIYVHGRQQHRQQLTNLLQKGAEFLLLRVKNSQSDWAQWEASLLKALRGKLASLPWPQEAGKRRRLLHEVRNKQKLVVGEEANLALTPLGEKYAAKL